MALEKSPRDGCMGCVSTALMAFAVWTVIFSVINCADSRSVKPTPSDVPKELK